MQVQEVLGSTFLTHRFATQTRCCQTSLAPRRGQSAEAKRLSQTCRRLGIGDLDGMCASCLEMATGRNAEAPAGRTSRGLHIVGERELHCGRGGPYVIFGEGVRGFRLGRLVGQVGRLPVLEGHFQIRRLCPDFRGLRATSNTEGVLGFFFGSIGAMLWSPMGCSAQLSILVTSTRKLKPRLAHSCRCGTRTRQACQSI